MNNSLTLISLYNISNLGVRYLASYLRNKNFDVSVIFFKNMFVNNAEKPSQKERHLLLETLSKKKPGIVGISVSCSALFNIAVSITQEIQSKLGIPVIWGGAHATIMPEESIKIANFVCAGEGEMPLYRLLNSLDNSGQNISTIPNLWIKKNGTIISNKIEPVDHTFCTLPFPDYSNKNKFYIGDNSLQLEDPFKKEPWVYMIITSKGCKYLST